MSPQTAAERKAAERKRKAEQGLVLKQIWVRPETWPVISDLSTADVEATVHGVIMSEEGGSYSGGDKYPDGISVPLVYEEAFSDLQMGLATGEVMYGPDMAGVYVMHKIRAMLKLYKPDDRAARELVEQIREEIGDGGEIISETLN